jgi:DNA-binding transcriptional LysR family regulator
VGGTPGALVSLRALSVMEMHQPHLTLNVVERPDRELIAMLRDGEIDLAFVTTAIEAPPADIAEQTLGRDPFALIVGRANNSLPDHFSLKDAARLRWVLPEAQGAFRRQVDALFLAAGAAVPSDAIRCDPADHQGHRARRHTRHHSADAGGGGGTVDRGAARDPAAGSQL